MIDMIDYLVGSVGENSSVPVGGQIAFPVDLSAFESRVVLKDPNDERTESIARPVELGGQQDDVLGRVQFENIGRQGFYQLGLKRHSGESQQVLFASNLDSDEGNLIRLESSKLESNFFGDKIQLISASELRNEKIEGGNTEIWPQIVWLLLAVLATEQFLGWWFGKRR